MVENMKKIFVMLLVMTFLVAAFPVMETNAKEETEIDAVGVTIDYSMLPSITIGDTVPGFAGYKEGEYSGALIIDNPNVYVKMQGWWMYDETEKEWAGAPGTQFANDVIYGYAFMLSPKSGYKFSVNNDILTESTGKNEKISLLYDVDERDISFCFLLGTVEQIENLKGGNSHSTPSGSSSIVEKPAEPIDAQAERAAQEESMDVSVVTIDATQYGKTEESIVPVTSYNLSKFVTTRGIVKGIMTAVTAASNEKKDVAEIYTGKPFCFNREIITAIQEGNKTVIYYFQYEGHIYSVTILATVDAGKVLEKAGFAGPLYVGQQLGTTKLIK